MEFQNFDAVQGNEIYGSAASRRPEHLSHNMILEEEARQYNQRYQTDDICILFHQDAILRAEGGSLNNEALHGSC
jgi:hypothetical protein